MSINKQKLTERDWSTLWRAWTLRTNFDAGIGVYSGGDAMHVRRLERLGILEYTGEGHDIDGLHDGERPVYGLTPAAIDLITGEIRAVRDRIVTQLAELLAASGGSVAARILSAPQVSSEDINKLFSGTSDASPTCEQMIACWKSMAFNDRRWGRWEFISSSILHAAKPPSKRSKAKIRRPQRGARA